MHHSNPNRPKNFKPAPWFRSGIACSTAANERIITAFTVTPSSHGAVNYSIIATKPTQINAKKGLRACLWGFNSMEKDDELKGSGNSYTTEWRQYDPRIGRFLSLDPAMIKYPGWSPYCFSFNNPVYWNDPNGDDPPEKEKKAILNAFKQALTRSAMNEAEEQFDNCLPVSKQLHKRTAINTSVDVERDDGPTFGGSQARRFTGNVSLDDNNQEVNAEIYYLPGKDKSFNVIENVEFRGLVATLSDGKHGWRIQFIGKNNREVGQILFQDEREYNKLMKQWDKAVRKHVLKLAKEYDIKNNTTKYQMCIDYYKKLDEYNRKLKN